MCIRDSYETFINSMQKRNGGKAFLRLNYRAVGLFLPVTNTTSLISILFQIVRIVFKSMRDEIF